MAEAGEKAAENLREITECSICMNAFTDPRILPCIHTFCFECLNRIGETAQKRPGDKMPCPLCRKEFIIPSDGMKVVQKNFFMESLLVYKTTLQIGSETIICDMCNIRTEGKVGQIPNATTRCLECHDYYCNSCVKVHQFQKVTRDHQMVKIGSDIKSQTKRLVSRKSCTKHIGKPLDYYCSECKKIVCVSCFVERHKSHDCKDVTTVDEEFRQTIERKASKISTWMNEMQFVRNKNEKRKAEFLKEIAKKEEEIHKRHQELKDIIDRHTKSLLDELFVLKSRNLKELETGQEEIDRYCTILGSFEAYCTELTLKGSASDICSSVDELIVRADDLERDHEAFIYRTHKSLKVFFHATNLRDVVLNHSNILLGNLEARTETTAQFENFAVVVGLDDDTTITEDVVKINLHQPNEIRLLDQIPTTMNMEAVAAVYDNMMYVAGIGENEDEIWKYNQTFGWKQCASLVQGRRRHSAAFVYEVLYICGGFVDSTELVLDSVEAYNALTNECTTVGKLAYAVESTGHRVPYRSSLYLFGGSDEDDRKVSHVQVYNTKENTCTLISKPMPRSFNLMRAVLCETSVILVGCQTCFIFNIESEKWQEREQFKTGGLHFGLILVNGRVFVIGGRVIEQDKGDKMVWTCTDDVRYVPLQNILDDNPIEWQLHGKLPKPACVHAYAKMRCLV